MLNEAREMEEQPLLSRPRVSFVPYVPFVLLLNAGICGSFYGWNSIAQTYISEVMGFPPNITTALVSGALFINYGFALLGGFLADAYLGNFLVLTFGTLGIIVASLVLLNVNLLSAYYAAHLFMPFSIVGIALFVIGNGISKPGLSAFMGDQFHETEAKLRSQWFSWFYMSIQIGALGFSIGTPFALQYLPAWVTFSIILAPALIGLALFLMPSRSYRKRIPGTNVFTRFFGILIAGMKGVRRFDEPHWLDKAKAKYDDQDVEDVKKCLRVLTIFVPLPFFWAVFFQMYSVWVYQAKLMDLHIGSFELPAGETTVLNGIIDIFLIPVFEKLLYPLIGRCFNFTPLRRIGAGHIFTIAALVVAGFVTLAIQEHPNQVPIYYILPQYLLISCGEILLSITGLEFAFGEAPASMKVMMTAIFMSTTALGNALISVLALINLELWLMNFVLAGIIFVVLCIFATIAHFYEYSKPVESVN